MTTELQSKEQNKPSFPQRLLDHPVTGLLISSLGLIPEVGPYIELGASATTIALRKMLEIHQKTKMERILTCISGYEEITIKDVNNVDVVFEFAQLLRQCEYETSNEKIDYLTKLFLGSVKENKPDKYEEQLNKLASLSIREINFLIDFYKIQHDKRIVINGGRIGFNARETWKQVVEHFKSDPYNMNETDCLGMAAGIQRTGFCLCEWGGLLDGASGFAYVVPEFDDVIDKLINLNFHDD